ncbi:hypothetical protein CBR_g38470 [Chara braunii]|uniref:CCHC-type domain-containing protein n=1 Tax=Chara braunii TaxID=69332 RepID=A0A388JNU4_CHABU|nr:hypothetical protein CBR_g38470 [Chara braunii]|eukprot:GBG59445.1 hypothetical protein CBR_g38470 [Chara braunii]
MSNDQRESGRGHGGNQERGPRRPPLICFACGEEGHYATQCRNPRPGWRGAQQARPSSSTDSRRGRSYSPHKHYRGSTSEDREAQSQVKEIGDSVATLREYIEVECAKKEAKARQKAERKEAECCAMEEKEAREGKAKKKAEKAREEDERVAAIRKDMDLHVKLNVKEALSRACAEFREAIVAAKLHEKMKGKKKLNYVPEEEFSEYEFVGSDMEEICERAQGLSINEKWKGGSEPVFEDSPPMELPAKRTPKRTPKRGILKPAKLTPRLTRSKTKAKVRLSPATKDRITSAVKRKIPATTGKIGRYKLRDEVM